MRVLDRDDPGRGDVHARPVADLGHDLLGREPTVDSGETDRQQAGMGCGPAQLRQHDVRVALDQERVPGSAEDVEGDLIRHGGGRQEDSLLLAEELRPTPLELVDRRILPLLLVSDGRARDRLPHRGRRLGERVRAEVDHRANFAVFKGQPVG